MSEGTARGAIMTTNENQAEAWLNTAEAKTAAAWSGTWIWELDDADRVTLHADGQVPFDLIRNDEFRGSTEDIDCIAYSRTAFPQAVAALQAVLDLHRKVAADYPYCGHDGEAWPCPSRQAITEKLGSHELDMSSRVPSLVTGTNQPITASPQPTRWASKPKEESHE